MYTQQQLRTLRFMSSHMREQGVAPTFDEIRSHLGLASKSGVHRLLSALEERGAIKRRFSKTRAIEICRHPDEPVALPAVPGLSSIPLAGRLHPGCGPESLRGGNGQLDVPDEMIRGGGEHVALAVTDGWLSGSGILGGDHLVIRLQDFAAPGDVVVAVLDGRRVALGRMPAIPGMAALLPLAEGGPSPSEGAATVAVHGRLAGMVRRY